VENPGFWLQGGKVDVPQRDRINTIYPNMAWNERKICQTVKKHLDESDSRHVACSGQLNVDVA